MIPSLSPGAGFVFGRGSSAMERSQRRSTRGEAGFRQAMQAGLSKRDGPRLLTDDFARWRFTALLALWALWDLLWEAIAHG